MEDVPEHPADAQIDDDPGWPVGFLVVSALAAVYVAVRLVQLGVRLFEWLT